MELKEELLHQLLAFFDELANADLDEIAADGGVTVGMVFQQQARDVYGPRVLAALSSEAPSPKSEETSPHDPRRHAADCSYHCDQYPWECDCGVLSSGEPTPADAPSGVISTLPPDALIPPGFVVAPREPTEEMIAAAVERLGLPWREIQRILEAYRLMIAALPPPGGGKGTDSTERAAAGPSACAAGEAPSQSEKDTLLDICDRLQDEGDRVYLGSTNDADALRALGRRVWTVMQP